MTRGTERGREQGMEQGMERGRPGHPRGPVLAAREAVVSTSTTPRRRWRTAAIGLVLATAPVTVTACGSDVVDDGVEQEVEEEVDGEEQEDD